MAKRIASVLTLVIGFFIFLAALGPGGFEDMETVDSHFETNLSSLGLLYQTSRRQYQCSQRYNFTGSIEDPNISVNVEISPVHPVSIPHGCVILTTEEILWRNNPCRISLLRMAMLGWPYGQDAFIPVFLMDYETPKAKAEFLIEYINSQDTNHIYTKPELSSADRQMLLDLLDQVFYTKV